MLTATCLALLALLHAYWGAGGRWPAQNDVTLAALVAGTRQMPSAAACHTVAVLLLLSALLVLAASDTVRFPLPASAVALGGWMPVVALTLRGLGGFLEARLRPQVREFPYHRWSIRLYSPVCLALAALGALELA